MNRILSIIMNSPWWIWPILIYLLIRGTLATRSRVVSIPRLFIIPIILFGLSYQKFLHFDKPLLMYLGSLSISILLGFSLGLKKRIIVLKKEYAIQISGSYQTLILLMLLFMFRYICGFLQATNPSLRAEYYVIETIGSAFFSGYFLGIALAYLYKFIKHP